MLHKQNSVQWEKLRRTQKCDCTKSLCGHTETDQQTADGGDGGSKAA